MKTVSLATGSYSDHSIQHHLVLPDGFDIDAVYAEAYAAAEASYNKRDKDPSNTLKQFERIAIERGATDLAVEELWFGDYSAAPKPEQFAEDHQG